MRKSSLLIVDDAPAVHKMIREALRTEKLIIYSAFDGESGIKEAVEAAPNLILMDIDLPKIDGLETCRRLKANERTRHTPILFLTADYSLHDKVKAFQMGAVDYITKPFRAEELRARIQSVVRNSKQNDRGDEFSMVDRLTGLFNRKYFETRLDGELARARRSAQALGCVLVDIDDMTRINTELGQEHGDAALIAVGQGIVQACRREDVVCRFGGDEFAVLAIGMKVGALQVVAERIRETLQLIRVNGQEVNASIGVSLSRFSTGMSLVVEAAEALESAQKAGGNGIVVGRDLLELRLAS